MKILVYEGPRKLVVEEVKDFPMNDDEMRIRTLYTGVSHGTEMNVYRGDAPFFNRRNAYDIRLFRPASTDEKWNYPIRSCDPDVWYMGYANVGEVVETGRNIKNIKAGDIVYSNAPHQSMIIKKENEVRVLPKNLKPECGVFYTNLMTTFNAILDSRIKLGDNVAISGLGTMGQLLVQLAKMSGALNVYGIDLLDKRLETALINGADKVYNPMEVED
ncbi:MAG: zinc-binding alcohol dehydrogenase, partial [Clostridia bacterium]|nr:zinc-binding alcohol dehydrogenase [Clostridia bacterium]